MFWFLFSTTVLILATVYDLLKDQKLKNLFLFLLLIILSYVTGFGSLVGQDHDNYAYLYNNYTSFADLKGYSIRFLADRYQIEFLYVLLMIFGNIIGLGEAGFFFIISFLTNFILYRVFIKSRNILFPTLLFIISVHFFQEVNLVRQMLAGAIVLLGMSYLEEEKYWKYFISIIIATLIHEAAIIFIIFIIKKFRKKKTNNSEEENNNSIILYILGGLWVISLLSAFIGLRFALLNDLIGLTLRGTHYESYVEGSGVGMQGAINYVYNILVPISFIVNKRKHFLFWLLFVLGCILNNIAVNIPNITRIAYYFSVLFYVFVPYICDKNNYNMLYGKGIILLKIFIIVYYVRALIFNQILNPDALLGSEMYSLYDFWR